jgi:sec-independent protein translocase protein TatC
MAEPSDELQPAEEQVEGGAVKSFLEHLEDLRWMLVKSGAAVLLAMMGCLFGVKQLVAVLDWPRVRAEQRHVAFLPENTNQVVTVQLGPVTLYSGAVKSNQLGSISLGTNQYVTVRMDPVVVGSNTVLRLSVETNGAVPESHGPKLIFMDPAAPFMFALHVAFFGGLILASPFVLYFIGEFVMPALKMIEKKYFFRAFIFGTVLFLMGVSFAYFMIMPAALKFAESYGDWMGVSVLAWNAVDYASFMIKFMFGMGAGFELPVVLLALVKIGVLDYAKLTAMRRYMVVGNLVLGALLTTPEVFTQVCMAISLQLLFELSVWIAWYWERQEKKRAANAAAGGG